MSDSYPVNHPIFASPAAMLEAVLKTCDTHPENRNPRVGSICVYSDGQGNHCLIGQMFADNGLPVPKSNVGVLGLLEDAGIDFMIGAKAAKAQRIADDGLTPGSSPGSPRWSLVAAELRHREALNG